MAEPKTNTGPAGVPPGGPWFVQPLTGTIQRQSNPVLAYGLVVTGWIGFASKTDAETVAHNYSIPAEARTAGAAASSTIDSVGSFLAKLSDASLWLRVAEIALGAILIAIGVAKLTNAIPAATKTAATVGKVAALA